MSILEELPADRDEKIDGPPAQSDIPAKSVAVIDG